MISQERLENCGFGREDEGVINGSFGREEGETNGGFGREEEGEIRYCDEGDGGVIFERKIRCWSGKLDMCVFRVKSYDWWVGLYPKFWTGLTMQLKALFIVIVKISRLRNIKILNVYIIIFFI